HLRLAEVDLVAAEDHADVAAAEARRADRAIATTEEPELVPVRGQPSRQPVLPGSSGGSRRDLRLAARPERLVDEVGTDGDHHHGPDLPETDPEDAERSKQEERSEPDLEKAPHPLALSSRPD